MRSLAAGCLCLVVITACNAAEELGDAGGVSDVGPSRPVPDSGPSDAGTSLDAAAGLDAGPMDADTSTTGCFAVTQDTPLDLDLRASLPTEITLTVNGTTAPSSAFGSRVQLSLVHAVHGAGATVTVPGEGAAVTRVDVVPGVHTTTFCGTGCVPPTAATYCTCTDMQVNLTGAPVVTDLRSSPVDLRIMLDSAPEALSRDSAYLIIEHVPARPNRRLSLPLPRTGPLQWQLGAFPGTYRLILLTGGLCSDDTKLCGSVDLGAVEVGDTPVLRAISVPTVRWSGQVTAAGQALSGMPGVPFGAFLLEAAGLPYVGSGVFLDDAGHYGARVVAGAYRATYRGFRTGTVGPPVGESRLFDDLDLTADRTLDIDLDVDDITIQATANGMALSPAASGAVQLIGAQGGVIAGLSLADFAGGQWSGSVLSGTRRAELQTGGPCDLGSNLPCVSGIVAENLDPTQPIALDIVSHRVQVELRVNGATLPDGSSTRGNLWFGPVGASQAFVTSYELPANGPAAFETRVAPGRYVLSYRPPSGDSCANAPLPCGPVMVREFDIEGPGSIVADLVTHRVAGQVRVDGASLAVPADTAKVVFRGLEGTTYSAPIAANGTYETWLPDATYEVSYAPFDACTDRDVPAPRPCAPQVLRPCAN